MQVQYAQSLVVCLIDTLDGQRKALLVMHCAEIPFMDIKETAFHPRITAQSSQGKATIPCEWL